ncbi:ATP-binding protein [Streptomyces sp. NPDC006339]|uniref:ATP-binding protein n=1 Tax=Streptomyces sp. NPDC006339 TaxID=3156755 RepID=UPI0033B40B7B
MNPDAILTYSQVLPPGQNSHPFPRAPAIYRYPERTPTRHSSTPARSASTRRSNREDNAGDQQATADAVAALRTVLEARLARKKTTVVDATNCERAVRAELVQAARRHAIPTVAVLMGTPVSLCVIRQTARTPDRAVPADTVRAQHTAAVTAFPGLRGEGFDHVVFVDQLHRLEPLLQRASNRRRADLGWDGHPGLGSLLLVRRVFGDEILPLWRWVDGSTLADGDRVAEITLGADRLILALRTDVDEEGDYAFDLLTNCPIDHECTAPAWTPAHSVTTLLDAITGALDDPDTICTVHGGYDDLDQEADDHAAGMDDDPYGRADLEEQYAAAVRE